MRYATASAHDLQEWGIQELELREADRETRTLTECAQRQTQRAKDIGATLSQANMLCRDAQAFLDRKGVKA